LTLNGSYAEKFREKRQKIQNNIYKTKVVIKNEAKHTIVRGIMKYVAEAKRDKTLNSVARHYCYHMSEIQPH